jgi:hypothetical protein
VVGVGGLGVTDEGEEDEYEDDDNAGRVEVAGRANGVSESCS